MSRSPLSNASKRISVSTGIDVTGEVMLTQGARFRIVIAICVWSWSFSSSVIVSQTR